MYYLKGLLLRLSGSSLGISSEMLSYGAEGLANSDVLKGLQRESLKIHKHLLKEDNNVVTLRVLATSI